MDLSSGILLGCIALSDAFATTILSNVVGATIGHFNAVTQLVSSKG